MAKSKIPKIFEPDEMKMFHIDPEWGIEEILSQEGLCYFD